MVFSFNFVVVTEPVSRCWRCSSNAKGSEFCADPFDESKANETQRLISLIDCFPPPNRPNTPNSSQSNQYIVCRKLEKIGEYFFFCKSSCICPKTPFQKLVDQFFVSISENDTVVIDRSCFWQEINNPTKCVNFDIPKHIKLVSCELCSDKDGCNHSSRMATQFGQLAALMAIPLAIAKIFSF